MPQTSETVALVLALCLLASPAGATGTRVDQAAGITVVRLRLARDTVVRAALEVESAQREVGVAQARFDAAQRTLDAAERERLDSRGRGPAAGPSDHDLAVAVEGHRRALRQLEASEGRLGRAEDRLLLARRVLDEAAAPRSRPQ